MSRNYVDQGEVVELYYSAGSTHIEPATFDTGEPIRVNSLPAVSLEPRTSTSTRTVAIVRGIFTVFVQTGSSIGNSGDILYLHDTDHTANLYDYETGFAWGDGEAPTDGIVDTAPAAPTGLGQTYYNTTTDMWHESESDGGSGFQWDSGTAPDSTDITIDPTAADQHAWDGSRWYTSSELSSGLRWGYLLETIPANVTRKVRVRIGY